MPFAGTTGTALALKLFHLQSEEQRGELYAKIID
jgi:hypothetical protein